MPKLTETRLRDLERRITKPPPRITLVRHLVDPGPEGPVDCGVIAIRRSNRNGPPISVVFNEPRTDLGDVAFASLTDEEIKGLAP